MGEDELSDETAAFLNVLRYFKIKREEAILEIFEMHRITAFLAKELAEYRSSSGYSIKQCGQNIKL